MFLAPQYDASSNSNKVLAATERKAHRDKRLCRFFFAIFALFCGQFIFACRFAALDSFPAIPRRNSKPVKPGQSQSNHFLTLTMPTTPPLHHSITPLLHYSTMASA